MAVKTLLLATFVVLLLCVWSTHARYLPTRSDNTKKEQIKEILRELLDMQAERASDMEKRFAVKRSIPSSALTSTYQLADNEQWN
jgi:hypothetical protein